MVSPPAPAILAVRTADDLNLSLPTSDFSSIQDKHLAICINGIQGNWATEGVLHRYFSKVDKVRNVELSEPLGNLGERHAL